MSNRRDPSGQVPLLNPDEARRLLQSLGVRVPPETSGTAPGGSPAGHMQYNTPQVEIGNQQRPFQNYTYTYDSKDSTLHIDTGNDTISVSQGAHGKLVYRGSHLTREMREPGWENGPMRDLLKDKEARAKMEERFGKEAVKKLEEDVEKKLGPSVEIGNQQRPFQNYTYTYDSKDSTLHIDTGNDTISVSQGADGKLVYRGSHLTREMRQPGWENGPMRDLLKDKEARAKMEERFGKEAVKQLEEDVEKKLSLPSFQRGSSEIDARSSYAHSDGKQGDSLGNFGTNDKVLAGLGRALLGTNPQMPEPGANPEGNRVAGGQQTQDTIHIG
jgi:hypothetical protein